MDIWKIHEKIRGLEEALSAANEMEWDDDSICHNLYLNDSPDPIKLTPRELTVSLKVVEWLFGDKE